MLWACAVQTKRFCYCAELNVRFLAPLKPGEQAQLSAELTLNRKDRIFEAKAELRNQSSVICATGRGKYLPIKESDAQALAEDFVGESTWHLGCS